jgi:hypothetical protein
VDTPFKRWRVPLSLAAVVMLSVSVVTVMREQAPEVLRPQPRPPSSISNDKPSSHADSASSVPEVPRTLAGGDSSSGVGLKPSAPGSGQGLRRDQESVGSISSSKQERPADRLQTGPFAEPSLPRAFPGTVEDKTARRAEAPAEAENMREKQSAPSAQPPAPAAPKVAVKPEADNRAAADASRARLAAAPASPPPAPVAAAPSGESLGGRLLKGAPEASADSMRENAPVMSQAVPPPPQAKPALAQAAARPAAAAAGVDFNQAPAKRLDQIVELHKQGRLDEARASFAEFRKRYPDHPLPPALKDWGPP